MNKRVFWIVGILAAVVFFGLAILWLSGPMAFGHAAYGMGPGMMSGGWAGFTWMGLVFGLIHITFWLVPTVIIVALVTWALQPRAEEQKSKES